ncbi:hypothetical protein KIW84_063138 [Lathyrus oleraceus]|uniref:Transposon protein n=1 Tax=Pisum sativum TaxID=3888 RepID=A0A9D4W6W6_PEA|nr:hypothetical protein KIW84_063138 [Pisum sativum]
MVGDAFWVNVTYDEQKDFDGDELSNEKAHKFYQLLKEMNTSLFEGSLDSKLLMCVRLFVVKSNLDVPDQCLEFFTQMMLDVTPTKDNLPTSFYDAKRLVSKLGLEVRKIDYCIRGCILFYDNGFGTNDIALEECKFCNSSRQLHDSKVYQSSPTFCMSKLPFFRPPHEADKYIKIVNDTNAEDVFTYVVEMNSEVDIYVEHNCGINVEGGYNDEGVERVERLEGGDNVVGEDIVNVEDNVVGEGSDGSDDSDGSNGSDNSDFQGHGLSFDDSDDEKALGLDDGFDEQAKIDGKRGRSKSIPRKYVI